MTTENLTLRMKSILEAMRLLEEKEAEAKKMSKAAAADAYIEILTQEQSEELEALRELYAKYEAEARQRALDGEEITGVIVVKDDAVLINTVEAVKWALAHGHSDWVDLTKEGTKAIETAILKRQFEVPKDVAFYVEGKSTKIYKEKILNGF